MPDAAMKARYTAIYRLRGYAGLPAGADPSIILDLHAPPLAVTATLTSPLLAARGYGASPHQASDPDHPQIVDLRTQFRCAYGIIYKFDGDGRR